MITISEKIGADNIKVVCQSTQKALAEGILEALKSIALQKPLEAGMKLRFGWTVFTLEDDATGGLILCEPDYYLDPIQFTRPEICISLDVLANQTVLMRLLNIEPLDIGFEQLIVIENEIIEAGSLLLSRSTGHNANDSGWSISQPDRVSDSGDADDYEVKKIYELLLLRPEILAVLTLPVGYMALIESKLITKIFNREGDELLMGNYFESVWDNS